MQRGREHAPAVCELIAVRLGHLADEAVRAQEPQLTADPSGHPTLLLGSGGGDTRVEDLPDVAVAETGGRELAAGGGREEGDVVGVANAQSAEAPVAVGSLTFPWGEFGMTAPSVAGFVSVTETATMEFDLQLQRA